MKEVKVGLIGLGFMGSTHFRIYKDLPNVSIVALADVDPVKLGLVFIVISQFSDSPEQIAKSAHVVEMRMGDKDRSRF